MIQLDIRKAFDSVDCTKLWAFKLRDWFRFYLSDGKQIFNMNDVESDPLAISCGVPKAVSWAPVCFYPMLMTCQALLVSVRNFGCPFARSNQNTCPTT